MCIFNGGLSGTLGKVIDPGGYLVEKTAPKAFAPYSGLHGTAKAMKPPEPALPVTASQKLLGE